jgi:DNA polymerase I-like protein with 3'-5' exonuclease and polymerase domains
LTSKPNFNSYIINSESLFNSLVRYEKEVESDILSYDLETDSKIEKLAKVYGIGICFSEMKAFYIPWRNKDGSMFWDDVQQKTILSWIEDSMSRKKVIGHNIIYDALVTEYEFDFSIVDYIHADTILMKHTLDEEKPFALKDIAPKLLGSWATKAQEQLKENVIASGGKWTEDQKDMYLADTEILGEYCCWDVMLTLLLYNLFSKKLKEEQLESLFYTEEVMPLYKEVTINMKRKGFPIDLKHFERLKEELHFEIDRIGAEIFTEISHLVKSYEQELLDKKYPVKNTGSFPKVFAEVYNIALPKTKQDKITLAKKALEEQRKTSLDINTLEFYDYCLKTITEPPTWIVEGRLEVQRKMYFDHNPGKNQIFNLSSSNHIGYLIYDCLNIKPLKFTDKGKPSTDKEVMDELIETYSSKEPWLAKLSDYRKLGKLLSTYVNGVIDNQIDGSIYTSMLQFGTTSGRYASRNINCQNLPRIKDEESGLSPMVLKYTNAIRKGFIAGPGRKIVNADYAQLEAVCFAHMSGDNGLREVFIKGEDLYSKVGIASFNIVGASADKKASNYLKNLYPNVRQDAKELTLAIAYGAEAGQVSKITGKSYSEAQEIIDNYLNGFPNLRKYMNKCNYLAKTAGIAKTELGRIRHLKEARSIYVLFGEKILDSRWAKSNNHADTRRKFRSLLNNAKNFPIQGLAAHIVNRSAIAMTRVFKKENLDAYIVLQVHDELTVIAKEEHSKRVLEIMKDCMENTTKISIKLIAEPLIATNWADAK